MKSDKLVRIGCGALIVNDNNEVLLLKRSVKARDEYGFWSQPGGGVEYGETIEQAIKREVKEELGVKVKLLNYLCYTDQIKVSGADHWVAISYLARIISGKEKNMEPGKHEGIRWFPITKLPKKLSLTTKDSTKAYLVSGL
jgi:mutator protein MutT